MDLEPAAGGPVSSVPAGGGPPRPRLLAFSFYVALLMTAAFAALAAASVSATQTHWTARLVLESVLVVVLAIGFHEFTRAYGRLHIRLGGEHMRPDMTSVWLVAVAVVLPHLAACIVALILLLHLWLRQQRPAGELLHRKLANGAMVICTVYVTGLVFGQMTGAVTNPSELYLSLSVVVAVIAYALVNRALASVALLLLGATPASLGASWDDNVIEIATLCLGGLAATALLLAPGLILLVVVPLVLIQRSAAVGQLEIAASLDAKTGLLEAVAWDELARRELVALTEEAGLRSAAAVLIVDLDRFKLVNDTYGHLFGDEVLRAVSECLRSELRGYDLVGRFGGEEFVALLPGADLERGVAIAERLRRRVNEIEFTSLPYNGVVDASHRLSVSIGVSCLPGHGEDLTDLLHAADGALYSAKQNGRNRVAVAGGEDPTVDASVDVPVGG